MRSRPVDKTEYKEPPDLHKDLSTFWKILPAGVGSRATIQVGTGKWKGYYLTHDDKGDDRTSHDVFLSKTQLPASIWTVSYGTLTKKDTISQGRWYLNVEKTSDEKYYSEKGVRETITFHRLRVTREKGPRFEIEEDSK